MRTRSHLKDLTECIREGDRPIGLFLGAGCAKSVSGPDGQPLIPDTKGMTAKIHDRAQEADVSESWNSILESVRNEEDETPNVEDVLSRVRGLLQYVGEQGIGDIDKNELSNLEDFICDNICEIVDERLPEVDTGYHGLATWIGEIDRSEPIEVFTSNYDLLIEQALEEQNIPYFDGFVGTRKPFFDPYSVSNDNIPARWLRFWKIHGSINWILSDEEKSSQVLRSENVSGEQAVIHPSHKKYDESRKMPFLALVDRLEDFIRRPESVLFIVGYSFGDEHINDVIVQGLKGEPSSAAFAFMYGDLGDNSDAISLAQKQRNLTLLARNGGVVGRGRVKWDEVEDEPEEDSVQPGAEWKQVEEGNWQEQLVLGDFREFGRFLKSVTAQAN